MDFTYLYPSEYVAQIIVKCQVVGFVLWTILLVYFFIRDLRIKWQINSIDVLDLRRRGLAGAFADNSILSGNNDENNAPRTSNGILRRHLNALTYSGQNRKQLDVPGLIKNTGSRLSANNTWLRSTLSLFIIVGLLGTLWGLASSLDQLSSLSPGGAQITNETLAQGLKSLLQKLGGAFAPSIVGVLFTIGGVLLFAAYLRLANLPLLNSLEHATLTSWAPNLTLQRTDETELMQENIKAAQQIGSAAKKIEENVGKLVVTFNESLPTLVQNLTQSVGEISKKLSSEATDLAEDVQKARQTLKSLTTASENLNKFSSTFKTSVEKLYPFSDAQELRQLYEDLVKRSGTIIEQNESFQGKIHQQLNELTEQKKQLIGAVTAFHNQIQTVSNAIVTDVGATSSAAKEAFNRLSSQNETLIKELVNQMGAPVVGALTPIPQTLASALAPIPQSLGSIENEVKRINTPLEGVKNSIAETSFQVIGHANNHLQKLDERLMAQVTNLKNLADGFNNLAPKIGGLSEKMDGFNQKVEVLGEKIKGFDQKADIVSEKFTQFHQKADEVIKETRKAPPVTRERPPRPDPPVQQPLDEGYFTRVINAIFNKRK